jgi:hypothetical protein
MTSWIRRIALLAAVVCALVGCDQGDLPDLAPVYGVVTLDGKPLANKQIIFAPAKGRPSLGATDEDGAYELSYTAQIKGAIIGQHVVTITTPLPEDGSLKDYKETVPAKYNVKTELKADVTSGRNKLNFDLKSN